MSNLPSQTNDGNSPVIDIEIPSVIKKIQRVPPHFKRNMTQHDVYDPRVVSLGPYHHGKEQFKQAEALKQVLLDGFVSESIGNNDKSFFHGKILERIGDIRSCYEDVEYDDQALSRIILYDACFLISFRPKIYDYDNFGMGRVAYMRRDILLLENQIPFWILKFLLCLQRGNTELEHAIWNEINFRRLMINEHLDIRDLNENHHDPFHLLDAYLSLVKVPIENFIGRYSIIFKISTRKESLTWSTLSRGRQYHSVTNLRKKGIRFKVSDQFNFTSHTLYGQLELPRLLVYFDQFDIYSNLIAYEMSSNIKAKFYMTSFVSFLKTLIDSPNDVNILREEGILFYDSASDDELVRMLKNLDTFGVENYSPFWEVIESIESHCSSKAKTWIAELINTNFRSPWTVVALLAAFCALLLTLLQTIFTILQK